MTIGLGYLIGAYLIGSVCSGWVLVRLLVGADLRVLGSRTIGARNAGRILGPIGFAGTLFGDCAKGGLVVATGFALHLDPAFIAGGMVLVVVGHTWPVFLRFHGGKGLATFLGTLFWFDLRLMSFFFIAWAFSWAVTRHASLACLVAVGLVPLLGFALGLSVDPQLTSPFNDGLFEAGPLQTGLLADLLPLHAGQGGVLVSGLLGQALIVLYAHAPNIKEYASQMSARRTLSSEMANA